MNSQRDNARLPKDRGPLQQTGKISKETISAAPKIKPVTFREYIRKDPRNRQYLIGGLLLSMALFLAYKYCYPLPDINSDAQGYIYAAAKNARIFYRPFGYSRFLQLIHGITESHYLTVAIQYFIGVAASLFCFFSVDFLFRFRNKKIKFISWLLVTVNPIVLTMSNLMLSDLLFVSLSVVWFTLLLWSQKKGAWWALILQLVFLYWCFQTRYNALYYPVLAAVVFLCAPGMKIPYRFAGLLSSFILIFATYNGIKNETYKATGAEVFSGFSGWQMANNALHIYKKAHVKPEIFDDPEQQLLDKIVRYYIDSITPGDRLAIERGELSSAYIWDKKGPLKRFTGYFINRYHINYYMSWYRVAPLYNDYGTTIIRHYPGIYFRHYILPNLGLYFFPDAEVLKTYDVGKTTLSEPTRKWFHISQEKFKPRVPGAEDMLMRPYPVFRVLLLLFSLIVPLMYLLKQRRREQGWKRYFIVPVLFWYCFLLMDMGFSAMASVMTLRYGAILFITGFTLPLYFLDQLISGTRTSPTQSTDQQQ